MTKLQWLIDLSDFCYLQSGINISNYVFDRILNIKHKSKDLEAEMNYDFFIIAKNEFENTIARDMFKSYASDYYREFKLNKIL